MSEQPPSSYIWLRDRWGFKISPEVDYACRFLDARGLSFLKDFGTKNAIPKAAAIIGWELGI